MMSWCTILGTQSRQDYQSEHGKSCGRGGPSYTLLTLGFCIPKHSGLRAVFEPEAPDTLQGNHYILSKDPNEHCTANSTHLLCIEPRNIWIYPIPWHRKLCCSHHPSRRACHCSEDGGQLLVSMLDLLQSPIPGPSLKPVEARSSD